MRPIPRPPARRTLTLLLLALAVAPAAARPAYPPSRVEVVSDTLHGVVVDDPYRWLEDQAAPETRAWIDAQNSFRESLMADVPGLPAMTARFAQLLKVDAMGTPFERGGRYFFTRRRADQDLNVLCMRRGLKGQDEVLFDPHPLSPDHSTSALFMDVSIDGRLAAIGQRDGGADEVRVIFRDLDTGQDLPDRMPLLRYYGFVIAPDRGGAWYSRYTPEGPRVYFHKLGTDPAQDPLVFGEGYDPQKFVDVSLSEEGRWLLFTVYVGSAGERSELWVKDLVAGGPVVPVVKDLDGFFTGAVAGDQLFVRTTWKAPRGRILRVDLRDPAPERWQEVVPEGLGVIEDFALAGGRLCVNVLESVTSRVRVYGADGKPRGEIAFPTPGTVGSLSGRWASSEAFFTFESFVTPRAIYRYDVAAGKRAEFWRPSVPFASGDYETRQVWYPSKDGTRVPMFIVQKKGLALDGARPVYLTGYGGFTVNLTPSYNARAALWVENGGVFAQPNLRGGSELGEEWHRAGMLGHKQNVFDDFIAAAQWLVANRYTNPGLIAIEGGSNGGLLVGAALTERPGMCRAVLCRYPLLDMLRYDKFLLGKLWVPEYGTAEDSAQFQYLRAWSPYQNVKQGTAYPAVLFVTGDADTRVAPLHARKMTALLQAATSSDRPVLLYYDTKAGHSSGSAVSKTVVENAIQMQFLFWQLGLPPPGSGTGAVRKAAATPPNPIDSPVGPVKH